MKLFQIPKRDKQLLAALGRAGCPEICIIAMSKKDEWKNFSDVYYALVAQTRMPWATYSKLVDYLTTQDFIEKNDRIINNRKSVSLKLTPSGKELVKMYLTVVGRRMDDLEPETEPEALRAQ